MNDGTETTRPPLLLLHGGGVAGWMWRPMTAHLRGSHRLIVPDLPGHGDQARNDYESHEATLARLIELLEDESAPASVVGFSLGAQLAVLLAARRPDLVSRVAVVSAQAVPTRAPGATLALLDATAGLAAHRWFATLQASSLFIPRDLLEEYLQTSATVSRRTLHNAVGDNIRFTVPEGWSAFGGPALILAGGKERAMMRRSAALLHAALPHSELEIVDGCGHGIPLQRPEWFARRIEDWIGDPTMRGADQAR